MTAGELGLTASANAADHTSGCLDDKNAPVSSRPESWWAREARLEAIRDLDRETIEHCKRVNLAAERERLPGQFGLEEAVRRVAPAELRQRLAQSVANERQRVRQGREEWKEIDRLLAADPMSVSVESSMQSWADPAAAEAQHHLGSDSVHVLTSIERAASPTREASSPCVEFSAASSDRECPIAMSKRGQAATSSAFAGIPKKYRRKTKQRDAQSYLWIRSILGEAPKASQSVKLKEFSCPICKEEEKTGTGKDLEGTIANSAAPRVRSTFPSWFEKLDSATPDGIERTMPAPFLELGEMGRRQVEFAYAAQKGIFDFTINLAPEVELRAYYGRDGSRRPNAAAWFQDRLRGELKAEALPLEVTSFLEEAEVFDDVERCERDAYGLPPRVRLHVHGFGVATGAQAKQLRRALKRAAGKVKWQHKGLECCRSLRKQCCLRFNPDDGWVGYCAKNRLHSSNFFRQRNPSHSAFFLGPADTSTREMSKNASAWYEKLRGQFKAAKQSAKRRRTGAGPEQIASPEGDSAAMKIAPSSAGSLESRSSADGQRLPQSEALSAPESIVASSGSSGSVRVGSNCERAAGDACALIARADHGSRAGSGKGNQGRTEVRASEARRLQGLVRRPLRVGRSRDAR